MKTQQWLALLLIASGSFLLGIHIGIIGTSRFFNHRVNALSARIDRMAVEAKSLGCLP